MGRLENKIAVVTGGTSGIGRKIVEVFLREGARVVFSGRREDLGREVEKATGARFLLADVTREDDARRTIEATLSEHGRVDVLVNNAGGPMLHSRLQDTDLDAFRGMLNLHVIGALAHIKHVAPAMRASRSGSIVNIGSVAGHRSGHSASIAYSVAKAGVIHLTRCAAMELGEDGIRVNCISPGTIATGIFAKAIGVESNKADSLAESVKDRLAAMQAIPRAGLTDDIAAAALFFASDESSFVNGDDMVVDGGMIWGKRYTEANPGGSPWKRLFD